jgi:hypothetical protein
MTSLTFKRFGLRALDFTIGQPLRAAWQYGSQAAITSASVSLNATFAMSHGILSPGFAWAQAIGFEWTYLRGLATAGQTKSRWVDALNIIAFVSVILYGLWPAWSPIRLSQTSLIQLRPSSWRWFTLCRSG